MREKLGGGFPYAIAVMLVALMIQFNSFRRGAITLLSVPLVIVGVPLALLSTGHPLSFFGTLGLIAKYPQLDHLLMYVREAHPGERQPQHASLDDKIAAARRTKERYQEDARPIVVDDINGAAHRFYGTMPNSIYIIAPNGRILFRSVWNNAHDIDAILGKIARGQQVVSRELKAVPPFSVRGARTLFYGGIVALWDFVRGLPRLIANHKKVGNM